MDQIIVKDLEVFTAGGDGRIVRHLLTAKLDTDLRRVSTAGGAIQGVSPESVAQQFLNTFEQQAGQKPEAILEKAAETVLLQNGDVRKVQLTLSRTIAGPGGSPYETAYMVTREWHTAYAAMSSNFGNMKNFVANGLKALSGNDLLRVLKNSRITHFDKSEKGECVNTVIELETLLPADELLQLLQVIEASLGRNYAAGSAECSLDLDLLLYDAEISADEHLLLPHPGLAKRAYVLKGMAEIAPYRYHPVLMKTMETLFKDAEKAEY